MHKYFLKTEGRVFLNHRNSFLSMKIFLYISPPMAINILCNELIKTNKQKNPRNLSYESNVNRLENNLKLVLCFYFYNFKLQGKIFLHSFLGVLHI